MSLGFRYVRDKLGPLRRFFVMGSSADLQKCLPRIMTVATSDAESTVEESWSRLACDWERIQMSTINSSPNRLAAELETYEKHLAELLAEGLGKYVLIHGAELLGVWDTYEDALKVGYEKCGVATPFLVKQISGLEQVQFFTRDLTTCPS
jgi:hypothetical protein